MSHLQLWTLNHHNIFFFSVQQKTFETNESSIDLWEERQWLQTTGQLVLSQMTPMKVHNIDPRSPDHHRLLLAHVNVYQRTIIIITPQTIKAATRIGELVENLETSWKPGLQTSFQLVRLVGCGLYYTSLSLHSTVLTGPVIRLHGVLSRALVPRDHIHTCTTVRNIFVSSFRKKIDNFQYFLLMIETVHKNQLYIIISKCAQTHSCNVEASSVASVVCDVCMV